MLRQAKLDSHQIKGYENEEFTHSAVAALVASGAVDCGFGIKAAAAQFKLTFIPLIWESYWFVLPTDQINIGAFRQFIDLLSSYQFTQNAAHLTGYDTSRSGTIITVDKDLFVLL